MTGRGGQTSAGTTRELPRAYSMQFFMKKTVAPTVMVDFEAYSLRHTYICFRLLHGALIYELAKNCRTNVRMIERHYAAHLKTQLDTAAINNTRPRPTVWGLASWLAKCRS